MTPFSSRATLDSGPAAGSAPITGKPLIDIRPTKKWYDIDLIGLWRHREMLLLLAQRDVKVRYKQTWLGVLWAVLQPLGPMLVFTLIFTRFIKAPAGPVPYALFVLSGLVPWTYFATGIANAGNSLVSQAGLVSKVYFPRIILPSATTLAGLVDFMVGCILLVVLMVYFDMAFSWRLLLFPVVMVLLVSLVFAIGLNMAALNTVYRDVRQALPLLLQLWLFLTPVIYAREVVPAEWQWLLVLNPATGIIEAFRSVFLGTPILWSHLGISAAMTLGFLVTGSILFVRMEKHLADYL